MDDCGIGSRLIIVKHLLKNIRKRDAKLVRGTDAEAYGQTGLWIIVHKQDTLACLCQADTEAF